jgi:hypothetical protein
MQTEFDCCVQRSTSTGEPMDASNEHVISSHLPSAFDPSAVSGITFPFGSVYPLA